MEIFLYQINKFLLMYGYDSIEEFIENTDSLLSKLEDKGIWNKDTLVIALDKAVRPLSFTMKKISDLEGKETPKIMFLNYSSQDGKKNLEEYYEQDKQLRSIVKKLNNYKNVIILDQHTHTGRSMENVCQFLKHKSKNTNLNYYFASYTSKTSRDPLFEYRHALRKRFQEMADRAETPVEEYMRGLLGDEYESNEMMLKNSHPLIFHKVDNDADSPSSDKTGIEDRVNKSLVSKRAGSKEFFQKRRRLIEGIKEYVSQHKKVLEQTLSLLLIFSGVLIESVPITGAVIGVSNGASFLSFLLIFLGVIGVLISSTKK